MQIIRDEKYTLKLQSILLYIATDNLSEALQFQLDLDHLIDNLPWMPYKFRKSIYFEDDNIRDLIFKGYVIPYKIDNDLNTITIIGINKYQQNL